MHTGWSKLHRYLYCQAAAQKEVSQLCSSDLTGGKSWRKQFMETAEGILSFAVKRNDLEGVLLLADHSQPKYKKWLCICLYVQANHSKPKFTDDLVPQTSNAPLSFASEGKGETKPNNNKVFNMGIKSKKAKCLKNYFLGRKHVLTKLGKPLSHVSKQNKSQDLSGNKKQWKFQGKHKPSFLYLSF